MMVGKYRRVALEIQMLLTKSMRGNSKEKKVEVTTKREHDGFFGEVDGNFNGRKEASQHR